MNLKSLLYLNNIFVPKKRQLLLQLSFLFFITLLKSQTIANYVNNGSFEDLYSCNLPAYLNKAKYWRSIDSITGNVGLFSSCAGLSNVPLSITYQWPKNGTNFAGGGIFGPNFPINSNRGYFRNRLKQNLQVGKVYCVKFYVNLFNNSTYGIDGFGAYFGDNTLDTITKCGIPLHI